MWGIYVKYLKCEEAVKIGCLLKFGVLSITVRFGKFWFDCEIGCDDAAMVIVNYESKTRD